MRIAILGTRGIPNTYGGFEQFAEYLSLGLVQRGHSVTVYNTSFHEYKESSYQGVNIRHIYSPEKTIGASANFIYDYLCLKDALRDNYDILYELGYHSNAPSYYFLKKNSPILITNMDGIEWKRSKWSSLTRQLIRRLETIAVKHSDYLVSDNQAIQKYYLDKYKTNSEYIPYGADLVEEFDKTVLNDYEVLPKKYFLLIARLEPENNIDMILNGYCNSNSEYPFLVIGDKKVKYGKYLCDRYKNRNIFFLDSIYNKRILDNLRHFARLYFHGHSVGGTNPSLLEAMASQCLIAAHKNQFNRAILEENTFYFSTSDEISQLIHKNEYDSQRSEFINENNEKIQTTYSWNKIISDYETFFQKVNLEKQRIKIL